MIKDYTPSRIINEDLYQIVFMYDENSGCGFNCDKDGNLLPMTTEAKANYLSCINNRNKFQVQGQKIKYTISYTTPPSGVCRCGNRIELEPRYLGACNCFNCGQWYNVFGEELLDPFDWEEQND